MQYSDTTVIIPTLNEGKNIGELLTIIQKSYPGIHVVVADDGSTDETCNIVKAASRKDKNIALVNRAQEPVKGITASVIDAVHACNTPFFVVIDGDLQHPPEKIRDLVKGLRGGNRVVVGTRSEVMTDWPFFRKLMSRGATLLGQFRLVLTGIRTSDPMSGFFGCEKALFEHQFHQHQPSFVLTGYKVLFDLLKNLPKSSAVAEVPYVFGSRKRGSSKIGLRHILAYLRSLVK